MTLRLIWETFIRGIAQEIRFKLFAIFCKPLLHIFAIHLLWIYAAIGFIFRLPIETAESDELVAEGTSSNKKDAVMACAVEACKLIQAYDMMQNKCKGRRGIDVPS